MGRALATLLAANGHLLALVGRTRDALDTTARACAGSPRVICCAADITNETAVAGLISATVSQCGRIDNLVNCAGIAPFLPISKTTSTTLHETFGVNTFGPAYLIMHAWSYFEAQRGGRIVNVSSLATTDPYAGFFAYAAAKSALDSFTRSAAKEGADIGVKVFSLNLGCVETALLRSFADEALVPRSRALSPESVAIIIAELLSGSRDHESGSCIPLPGPE